MRQSRLRALISSLGGASISSNKLTFLAGDEGEILPNGHIRVNDVRAQTWVQVLRPKVVLDVVEAEELLAGLGLALLADSLGLAKLVRFADRLESVVGVF